MTRYKGIKVQPEVWYLCISCVSLLRSPNLWLIHIMANIYGEQEKCVKDCLNIPVDSASGHGQ